MTSANARAPESAAAEAAVTRLVELSADLRGCAVLDSDGAVLASRGEWEAGAALLESREAEGGAHAPIDDGEAFAVRGRGLAAVAVSDRPTLAGLMLFDLHEALDAAAGSG